MPLWPGHPPLWNPAHPGPFPYMEWYPAGDGVRPCVAAFPGGGYSRLAPHEGEGYARFWNAEGFHAAVIHYRTQCEASPQPLREGPLYDAMRAMRLLRANAASLGIDPKRIAATGSSAGGHLAGSLAVHGAASESPTEDNLAPLHAVPDAVILAYPVITAGEFAHGGSFWNLCGESGSNPERQAYFSLENHVGASTPPTFLWHTVEDNGVPVENAMLFAQALRREGRPFELHLFARGRHGLGLAADIPGTNQWPGLAAAWLCQQFSAD